MTAQPLPDEPELISLEELTERVGISVRNVRFYTTRGLLPPPIKRGRSGYYSPEHIARLELVKELQAHGFTLSAIEKYVARLPEESSPEEIAVHRVTLQPWIVEDPRLVGRRELEQLAGRRLTDDEIVRLVALEVVADNGDGKYSVVASRVSTGLDLLTSDVPLDVLRACNEIYTKHGQAIAQELTDVFQTMLWPKYREGEIPADHMVRMLESFQPASVAALVDAFSKAMTEMRRGHAAKRTT
jgi:DNA-binding transcriptional MerR regulator